MYDYLNAGLQPVSFRVAPADDRSAANLALPITAEPEANLERLRRHLGEEGAQRIVAQIEGGQISAGFRDTTALEGKGDLNWVLLVGLGEVDPTQVDTMRDRVRSTAAIAARRFRAMNLQSFACCDFADFGMDPEDAAGLMAEGVLLGTYRFERYKSTENQEHKGERPLESVTLLTDAAGAGLNSAFAAAVSDVRATCLARNLINTRAADLSPEDFARAVAELPTSVDGLQVEVLDEEAMAKENLHMHLAVGRGSARPPRLVILRYAGRDPAAEDWDLAIVGKGVTFDSGGYNIKPSGSMLRMYRDMAGAGAALGAIVAIALRKLPLNAACVLPLADNLINGEAFKPGDILSSRKGLSVEILNTDAEGRLLLGDALTYATDTFAPRTLIDLATLTGAVRVALGLFASGLFVHGSDTAAEASLAAGLDTAGRRSGEAVWRLPVSDHYKAQLKSDQADLQNCSTDRVAGAGSITAAVFLKQFIDFGAIGAWAHLDIAATAYMQRALVHNLSPYQPREGATGVGTRLIVEYARSLCR
jgi:leucyl aminopeptidase